MPYLDTAYLVRLYLPDSGWEIVRGFVQASSEVPAACIHARTEVVAALHRALREGRTDAAQFSTLLDQFEQDCAAVKFKWLPISDGVLARLATGFRSLPAAVFLRSADALHIACAAEHGFAEIHSNDARLLAAAAHFGIKGVNLIP